MYAFLMQSYRSNKMPTLILKQKITKGYDHWLAAFDGAEGLRNSKYDVLKKILLNPLEFVNCYH